MKKLILPILFAGTIAFGFSCKDEVEQVTECATAADEYKDANAAAVANPLSKSHCEAQNAAVGNYRAKCENLPEGVDSINCAIYDIPEILD